MLKMSHDIFKEQRIVIKFLLKLRKIGAEIMPMLNEYSEITMKKSAVYDWIQHFWDGREDVNDDLGHGWLIETRTPSNVECVK